jgi:C4-dicarboxylate-specific signal transduction histidine kinase
MDERLRRHDGVYHWFHFRASPRFDADGQLIRWYGLLTDIDDLKRADEALRVTQARLSRATHLATVSELSASIAHEINQPLAAIVSNGHACHRWLSCDPPNVDRALLSAERIVRDGNSSAEVIRRMRSLFSHAPLLEALLSMNSVIEEVCNLLAEEFRISGVTLRTDLPDNLPLVSVDRVQILQVIANLARNGIEAMEGVTGRSRELLISARRDDHEVTVHVTDRGPGIGDAPTLFEPFYTTKSTGMGMGLAICRSIVEAHGGRIWAINATPHGATFAFSLRIAATLPRPAPE